MNPSEHVELLNMMLAVSNNVNDWNKWRRENPDVKPRLYEADLKGKQMRGINLSNADLRNSQLSRADLTAANLIEANLSRAFLQRTNLSEANMAGAILAMSDLSKAKLAGADFHNANLANAILGEADFSTASMYRANLRGANLSRANLCDANLRGANLRETNLFQVDMTNATLSGANFTGARLKNTRFSSRSMLNYLTPLLTDEQLAGAIFEDEEALHKEKSYLIDDADVENVSFNIAGIAPLTPLDFGFLLTGIQFSYNRFDYLLSTEDTDIKRIHYIATTTPCYVGVERDIQVRSITRGSWIMELTRLVQHIPPELLNMGVLLGFGKFAQYITTAVKNVYEAAKLKAEREKSKAETQRLMAGNYAPGQENGLDTPSMFPTVCPDNAPITSGEKTELFSAVQCDPAVRQAATEALAANPGLAQHPDILIEAFRPLQLGIYNVIKNGERDVAVTVILAGEKEAQPRK